MSIPVATYAVGQKAQMRTMCAICKRSKVVEITRVFERVLPHSDGPRYHVICVVCEAAPTQLLLQSAFTEPTKSSKREAAEAGQERVNRTQHRVLKLQGER